MRHFIYSLLTCSLLFACHFTNNTYENHLQVEQELNRQCTILAKENERLMDQFEHYSWSWAKADMIYKAGLTARQAIDTYRENLVLACPSQKIGDVECQVKYSIEDVNATLLGIDLNHYVDIINKAIEDESFDKIAKSAAELEEYKDAPEQKDKDFAQLHFGEASPITALATLTQFELEVLQVQQEAFQLLLQKSKEEQQSRLKSSHQ